MITIKPEANTSTTLAVCVTVENATRYYHVNKMELGSPWNKRLAKKSAEKLAEYATTFQEFLNRDGRTYKSEKDALSLQLFELSLDEFKCAIADVRAATSRKKLDQIIEDVIYTICAAYVLKQEEVVQTVPELIKAMSDGYTPVLTQKQRDSIKQIAERKQAKDDTSAAWWRILKTLEG